MREKSPTRLLKVESSKRGGYLTWLTGGALAICIFLIAAMIWVILANAVPYFWPRDVVLYELKDGTKKLAITRQLETVPHAQAKEQGILEDPERRLVMVGNRDIYNQDFVWLNDASIVSESEPPDVWVMERHEYGNFIGFLKSLDLNGRRLEGVEAARALPGAVAKAQQVFRKIYRTERVEIGKINILIEQNRLERLKTKNSLKGDRLVEALKRMDEQDAELQKRYQALVMEVNTLRSDMAPNKIQVADVEGVVKELPLLAVIEAWQPNKMGWFSKVWFYIHHVIGFLLDDPREANTEGGVFPAIFGTAIMVILMSIAVVPFGVLTAFYLCEYAHQGTMVRIVRIAINNLAGVPSIVYGIFGLGFFVYFVGGTIDQLFYPEALPNPTWGTGGILWASLTLALLTLPVVILATEESIQAIPRSMREGSFALGASKFQTIRKILLPASLPGILTGVILAMARGAGEVAPLMITGVVKLAPSLVIDGIAPYFHFERKFMHLGFHIYDVGFQSPNVEASRPMVFATAMLLLFLVIALNMGAILLRDRIRRRYKSGAFN